MAQAEYEFQYYNCQGVYQQSLEGIIEATFGREKNEVGSMEILLPAELYADSDFEIDGQILIYRLNELTNNFDLIGATKWFVRQIIYSIDQQCVENVQLILEDSMTLLKRRVIAYLQDDGLDNRPVGVNIIEVDDAMKTIVHYNYSDSVDGTPDANFPNFASYNPAFGVPGAVTTIYGSVPLRDQHRPFTINIAAFESSGVTVTANYELITVLDALQNLGSLAKTQGQNVWFDMVYNDVTDEFTFQTWVNRRGNDLTESKFVGPEFSNLINASYTIDATDSCDIVYVSGAGQQALKLIGAATEGLNENKPFRPIECIVNNTQLDTQTAVDNQAAIEAANRRTEPIIEGEILNIPGTRLFSDMQYGDVISADWRGVQFPIELYQFSVNISAEGEDVELPFRQLLEPFN